MLTRYEVTLLALRALKVTVSLGSRSVSHLSSHLALKTSRWVQGMWEKTSDGCVFSTKHQKSFFI